MMQQALDDFTRPAGVRFCEQVPESECLGCKFSRSGHPLIQSLDDPESFHKLCVKDCLKMKVFMKYLKSADEYIIKR